MVQYLPAGTKTKQSEAQDNSDQANDGNRDIKTADIVIVVGLSKSGASSIGAALTNSSMKVAHLSLQGGDKEVCRGHYPVAAVTVGSKAHPVTWGVVNTTHADICYVCVVMQRAMAEGKPPLAYLTDQGYQAFTQMDMCVPRDGLTIFPQVTCAGHFDLYHAPVRFDRCK